MQRLNKTSVIALATIFMCLWAVAAVSGDTEKGKTKSEICAGCHGVDGISVSAIIPNLAGQKEQYLINSTKAFKSGMRKNGMMASVIDFVTENDIEDIAAYYSSLGN